MRRFYIGGGGASTGESFDVGGTYGYSSELEIPRPSPSIPPPPGVTPSVESERWGLEGWPMHWDLLNQNWMVQLVPATASRTPEILQTQPSSEFHMYKLPSFQGTTVVEFKLLNGH
jgi:hypothetical protein